MTWAVSLQVKAFVLLVLFPLLPTFLFSLPDSLYLSLLIENRGTKALDVKIVAPDFVNLERTSVKLQAKRNEEVCILSSCVLCASDTNISI